MAPSTTPGRCNVAAIFYYKDNLIHIAARVHTMAQSGFSYVSGSKFVTIPIGQVTTFGNQIFF